MIEAYAVERREGVGGKKTSAFARDVIVRKRAKSKGKSEPRRRCAHGVERRWGYAAVG